MIASHVIDNRKVAIMDWDEYEQLKAKAEQNNFSDLDGVVWTAKDLAQHLHLGYQTTMTIIKYDGHWSKKFKPYVHKSGRCWQIMAGGFMRTWVRCNKEELFRSVNANRKQVYGG